MIAKSTTFRRWSIWCGVAAFLLMTTIGAEAQITQGRPTQGVVEIVTGSMAETSARAVEDLADVLDDGATRRIVPVIGKGSLQNLADLQWLRGVDVAIVQTDVLEYARTKLYPGIEKSISYVTQLYNEEFHLLARDDIKSIADLAGKKVNFGTPGDGTAITGPTLFAMLKIPVEQTTYDPETALAKLRAHAIDAMGYVTAKPVPLFLALRPTDHLHFLAIPLNSQIISAYVPAHLTALDYPDLLPANASIATVGVGTTMLVANLPPQSERYRNVANFVDAFFTQFSRLRETPHQAKWREVDLSAELPQRWKRFPPASAWLAENLTAARSVGEKEMHQTFVQFLDERAQASGQPISPIAKEQLYQAFKQWQGSQQR
jgi:uncharacterized protein